MLVKKKILRAEYPQLNIKIMINIIIKFLFIKISNSENVRNSIFIPKIGN